MKNINFSYNNNRQVLKNLSLEINKGDFIGIIGLSGAGKSTLADVLMGLLPPDSGEIMVDNITLNNKNYSKFRHMIGYVPQQVNVIVKSFKVNVAWGCTNINEEGVIKALKAAQIYDVIQEYPEGINANAIVGSNGLSQGQKQRLAIARALYRDAEILIFDEATSSLDVQVENEITEMLKTLSSSKL
ncbi:MAG: ATP-binding cassette domain-containing protein [Candidatus Gastranaerophilaceae bacterium]